MLDGMIRRLDGVVQLVKTYRRADTFALGARKEETSVRIAF